MAKLKLFLADDHPLLRAGLKAVLNAQTDMEVVGECSEGTAVADSVVACGADIVIIDAVLPGMTGARATEMVLRLQPTLKVLAVSAYDEPAYVEDMIAAGASGYVVKQAAPEELLQAIRRVAKGDTFIDQRVAAALAARSAESRPKLSEREFTVLRGVARGLTLKEIATSLDVSVRSVETYRERAMDKANLKTRADVIRYAAARGWLTGD